jgi:hypothetical protein
LFGRGVSPILPLVARPGREARLEDDICVHIFTVSAGMVGVCLTVIGLIRVVITLRKTDTFADDLLAMDALLFLIACLASYWALRTRSAKRKYRVERFADLVFVLALILMAGACLFVTYRIAILK